MHKRLRSYFPRLSFQVKLSLCLSCVCVLVILCVGIVSYRIAASELHNLSAKISENNTKSAEASLSGYLSGAQFWTTQILQIDEIRNSDDTVPAEYGTYSETAGLAFSIGQYVRAAEAEGITFRAIEFYAKDTFSFVYPTKYSTQLQSYDDCLAMLEKQGFFISDSYSRTQWVVCPYQELQSNNSCNFLTIVRYLYDSGTMEKKGILLAALDPEELSSTFVGYASNSVIVTNSGTILASSASAEIGGAFEDAQLLENIQNHTDNLSTFSYINTRGKKVMYSSYPVMDRSAYLVVPFDYYTGISQEEMQHYVISIVVMMAIVSGFALFLAMKLSKKLAQSLSELTNVVKRIDGGELDTRCEISGEDEIAYLSEKINNMLDSIAASSRVREMDLETTRLLEIKLLQSQINPHLLYNTLDSVLWFMQNNQEDDATALLAALSNFFKLSLSKGNSAIPLKNEIQLIQYYLVIQRLARQQEITFEVDIPPDLMEMPFTKLTLQPIVENAILHGFAGYRNDGNISIHAIRSSDCIRILVTDNGIGLMPEEIQAIHNTLRQYPPPPNMLFFGLYNINWRVKRTYGNKYGLFLDSVVSEYTTVTLTLPLP